MNSLNLSMFRAYDIRTPAESLTEELADRLARAESVYFKDDLGVRGVLLAHDARNLGPEYLAIGAEVFSQAGLEVVMIPHVCSTSQFYFAAMRFPDYAGIMYGASHNPAGDTGQKILGPSVLPIAESIGPLGGLDRIKKLYIENARPNFGGSKPRIAHYDPTGEYIDYSMSLAGAASGDLSGVKILHDYLNGAAGPEMMRAFAAAGAELTPLHSEPDGRFPLGDPNPVKKAVIQEAISAMREGDYLLASIFDGDGDRIDVYSGDGRYLSSSFVYAAILPSILERFPGRAGIYADLKANPLAVIEMARAGARVKVIRNGHSQIKNALLEDREMIGAVEESAHFYERFPAPANAGTQSDSEFATENTLYVALLIARAWKENPGRFDELFTIQSQSSREREWGYKFPSDQLRQNALDAVQKHFSESGALCMNRMANGYDLEATLMRRGLPFEIDSASRLDRDWLQVCQRISQSENGLARWEVVAALPETAADAKKDISGIVREFGAGEEYQG